MRECKGCGSIKLKRISGGVRCVKCGKVNKEKEFGKGVQGDFMLDRRAELDFEELMRESGRYAMLWRV